MNNYKIYFYFEGYDLHRSVHESNPSEDISEVFGLIDLISSAEDIIGIYIIKNKLKVEIEGCNDGCCKIYVFDSSWFCSRKFLKSELKNFLRNELKGLCPSVLELCVYDPGRFGFVVENY